MDIKTRLIHMFSTRETNFRSNDRYIESEGVWKKAFHASGGNEKKAKLT